MRTPSPQAPLLTVEEAAARLGTTARALRHREALGLLPPTRTQRGAHRRYGRAALDAATLGGHLEERHGVPPAALAFALRVVAEPALAAQVRALAEVCGHVPPPHAALDFDQEKALRLLGAGPRAGTGGASAPSTRR